MPTDEQSPLKFAALLSLGLSNRNVVASGGEQGQLQIWDLRRSESPISRFYGHSHWVKSVRFNPLHDDLVLSGGTDGVVHLWRGYADDTVRQIEHQTEPSVRPGSRHLLYLNFSPFRADVAYRSPV